jgi:hypothetical protein
MRGLIPPVAALLLGSALSLWQGRMLGGPRDLPPPAKAAPASLGVASCASAACHHANGDLGSRGSEYSTWAAVDPHSRAYQALFNEGSKRIQKNLGPGKAHENKLCLQCHGLGAEAPQALQADGASCEQCHGPAEHWKNTHYLNGFDRATPGFVDLRNDRKARVRSCMKCHVGDGSREVNHDLIAAGHPRLKFEFAAYYANYPKHWVDQEAKERKAYPAMEARNWLQGQAASAQAALELLASRASRAEAPWPEFAEADCASCHHGLTTPSERQKRAAERAEAARKQGKKYIAGAIPWATWYTGMLPAIKGRAPGKSSEKLEGLLQEIDEEMKQRLPSREKVARLAGEAAALLAAWADAESRAELDEAAIRQILARITSAEGFIEEGWDGGTQAYLGVSAMSFALAEMGKPVKGLPVKEIHDALRASFPKAKGVRPLYDTPSEYRPKPVLELFLQARKAVAPPG